MKDLRIVIVSWNVEALLATCLWSLKEACGSLAWECVVVDNASKDGSVALARRVASEESRVTVIANEKNVGFGKACNQGTKGSEARYVLYLNPDAHCPPGSLEQFVKVADERPRAAILGPKIVYPDGRYQESVRRFPDVWSMAGIFLKLHRLFKSLPVFRHYFAADLNERFAKGGRAELEPQPVDQVMGACFLARREFIEQTGGYDERYFIWFEEVDWCKTAITNGWEVLYVPSMTVVHAQGKAFGQVFSLKRQRYLVRSAIQYFEKWHPGWQAKLLKCLKPLSLFEAWVVGVLQLPGAMWLVGLVLVEILSAVTLYHSKVISAVTLLVALFVFIAAWKRPVWALGVLLLELLVGSKGQLLQFGIWPATVSGRICFTVAFLLGWGLSMLKRERLRDLRALIKTYRAYIVLLVLITYGFIRGYAMHNGHNVIADGNAWLDWIFLFPILEIAQRYSKTIRRSLAPVLVVGVLWLALKTLGLEYIFSHGFKFSSYMYLWVRRSGVGEVTLVLGNAFRIFMQSYVYATAAWLLALAWWVGRERTKAEPKESSARLAWFLLASSTFILGISLSRSYWLGLAAGGVMLLGLLLKTKSMHWKRILGPITASVFGLFLIFVTLAFPLPKTNVASLGDLFGSRTNMSEAAAVSRWNLIPVLMKKIEQHPLLGSGFGATVTYRSYDPRILASNPSGSDTTYAFEWGWLEHWIKFGTLGIPVILWLLISLGWRLWKSEESLWLRVGAVSSLVALGVLHFFTPYLNHPLGFLYFFVGEVILVTSLSSRSNKIREN